MGESEVLVAGGGPAGLAAAIAARQAGFEVTVVDCAEPPIDKACGEGIMPDGLAALMRLGISLNGMVGAPFRGVRFLCQRDEVEASFSHNVGYGIRRKNLHQRMVDRAAALGVALHWRSRITGLSARGILVNGKPARFQWLICADGQNSKLRRLAGLGAGRCLASRFGFRRHYKIAPWSDHVEVHWADCGQMYVTPVSAGELCIAFVTRHRQLRFDEAFREFPLLAARLSGIKAEQDYLGALTTTRKFAAVHRQNIALVGEASGSVDAVTGQGLSLAFQQALALADALRAGDLRRYEASHRRIMRLPRIMSALMLAMDRHAGFRQQAMRALAREPDCFDRMLAVHTGAMRLSDFGMLHGLALGWRLLTADAAEAAEQCKLRKLSLAKRDGR